jgi:hypothetical protein
MLHDILIILHAAAGVASFVAGCLVLLPPTERSNKRWLFLIYFASLMALVGFLLLVIGVDWSDLVLVQRLVFSGLALLGLYMAWHATGREGLVGYVGAGGWRARHREAGSEGVISLLLSETYGLCAVDAAIV